MERSGIRVSGGANWSLGGLGGGCEGGGDEGLGEGGGGLGGGLKGGESGGLLGGLGGVRGGARGVGGRPGGQMGSCDPSGGGARGRLGGGDDVWEAARSAKRSARRNTIASHPAPARSTQLRLLARSALSACVSPPSHWCARMRAPPSLSLSLSLSLFLFLSFSLSTLSLFSLSHLRLLSSLLLHHLFFTISPSPISLVARPGALFFLLSLFSPFFSI
eukprot:scaffold89629_cov25-Tisochrysis_lutea.AAC.1